MNKLFLVLFCVVSNCLLSQLESSKWIVLPNSLIDFENGSPILANQGSIIEFQESSTCFSDKNGNLLFYTDGVTIWDSNNSVIANGEDLASIAVRSTTQGSIFVADPVDSNHVYLFSLSPFGELTYSLIDKTLNGGTGQVISKRNSIVEDTLSEKMAVTKHCDNSSFWLVVVKYKDLHFPDGPSGEYTLEFNSFLISRNGFNFSPVKSHVEAICPRYGQMKFNNSGNALAYAESNHLILLDFDKSTGVVSLKDQMSLALDNGYGIEFSPNDSIVYINEKQYHIFLNELTSLYDHCSPGQLQRGIDGKIYGRFYPKEEITIYSSNQGYAGNNALLTANMDEISHLSSIHEPNVSGLAATFEAEAITLNHEGIARNYFSMPYFSSYTFNNKRSDFVFSDLCVDFPINFYLSNGYSAIDSVHWYVPDLDELQSQDTAEIVFPFSGSWLVQSIVYIDGQTINSNQCIEVCGENSINLPRYVDLCEKEPFGVNPISTCAISYLWNTGDTTSSLYVENESLYILNTDTECGLMKDTMEVFLSEYCTIESKIPNIITVNNDGVNDFFTIQYKNATALEYTILNRWGNIILKDQIIVPESSTWKWNKSTIWDGNNIDGSQVNDGTYFYRISFQTASAKIIDKTGFIQVVK